METEVNKKELFVYLNKYMKDDPNDMNQFFDWLLEDYYLLFLNDSLQEIKYEFELENYISFLKKAIYLRFNAIINEEENDPIRFFSMKILWLESNKEYIEKLLDIYQKLSINEENLLTKIDKIIDSQEIQYEISDRSPQFTEEYNSSFFLLNESLLKISINNYEMYKKIMPKDFLILMN